MIRRAKEKDIPKILDLLLQVCEVHHVARPDLFQLGTKYTEAELRELIHDPDRPIFVCVDEQDVVQGYCFGILQSQGNHPVMTNVKTLYIDDLCVDASLRGKHIGKRLYESAVRFAKESGCYHVTLNVWNCNPSAMRFYEALGMVPQKTGMELILGDPESYVF